MSNTKAYQQLSDEELIDRFRHSNDNQWLGILLPRYTMLLLGVALKYLKDKSAAEDAVQHVFLKALTQFPKGEIQNFKGWLYVLMRNHCLQILRSSHFNTSDDGLQYLANDVDTEDAVFKDFSLAQMELALN